MERVERGKRSKRKLDRRHLRREIRTALELAIVALAPPAVVDGLAAAAGFLEALEDLPTDTPPVRELTDALTNRAAEAIDRWSEWRASRGPATA